MAQGGPSLGLDEREADFWGDIVDPGRQGFMAALKRGKAYYQSAVATRSHLSAALLTPLLREGAAQNHGQLRLAAMNSALANFKAAVKASPRRAEGHQWLGKALYMMANMVVAGGPDGAPHDPAGMKAAAASFTRARELDPTLLEDFDIAFEMAIINSSAGKLERAVMEYERAERIVSASGDRSQDKRRRRAQVLGNAAECLMGLGRLEEAIQRYQEALTIGYGTELTHWGLAVALDRDEQQDKALSHARRAMSRDRFMKTLTGSGVFFVPAGELHYYYAVGHMAAGKQELARRSFEAFLAKLPDSQWASRARVHLDQLGGADGEPRPAPAKALAPKPGQTGADLEARDRSRYRLKVGSRLSHVRRCYAERLKKKSSLAGRVKVAFSVGKKGKALKLRIKHATLRDAGLKRCMFKVIKAIYFQRPTSGKVVGLEYTFEFRPLQ